METTLTTIIRDENRQPLGIAVIQRNGEDIRYGYSLLNTTADRYSKKTGLKIALARANSEHGYLLPSVPEREARVMEAYKLLEDRAMRYFKDLDPSFIALVNIEKTVD